jgi:hypothetical protein
MRLGGEALGARPWTRRGEKPQDCEDLPAAGRLRPALHVLGVERKVVGGAVEDEAGLRDWEEWSYGKHQQT